MAYDPTNSDVDLVFIDDFPFDGTDDDGTDLFKFKVVGDLTEETATRSIRGGSQSQITFEVPWGWRWEFQYKALGVSYSDNVNKRLIRRLPMRNPRAWNEWCTAILNVQGVGYRGDEDGAVVADDPQVPTYEKAWITCQFQTIAGNILADEDISAEYERYVEFRPESRTEFVESLVGSWKYIEGPQAGNPFNRELTLRRQVVAINMLWKEVPFDFVANTSGLLTKIYDRVQTANNADFLGFTKHTLLLQDPTFVMYPLVWETTILGKPKYCLDISLTFLHYDPTTSSSDYKGWLTAPIRGNGDAPNATHYGISHDGTGGGTKPYELTDYSGLFAHWNS